MSSEITETFSNHQNGYTNVTLRGKLHCLYKKARKKDDTLVHWQLLIMDMGLKPSDSLLPLSLVKKS